MLRAVTLFALLAVFAVAHGAEEDFTTLLDEMDLEPVDQDHPSIDVELGEGEGVNVERSAKPFSGTIFLNPRIDNLRDGGRQPNNARMCCKGGHTNDKAMINRFCKWKGFTKGVMYTSAMDTKTRVSCAVYKPGNRRRWDGGHGCHFTAIHCVGNRRVVEKDNDRARKIFHNPRINNLRDGGSQPNNARMCCNGGHTDDNAMVDRYCQTQGYKYGSLRRSSKRGGRVSCAVYKPGHNRRWDGGHGCHFNKIYCISKVGRGNKIFPSPRINNLGDGASQPNNARMCAKGSHTNDKAMANRFCKWKGYAKGVLSKSVRRCYRRVSCAVYKPGNRRRWDGSHSCHFISIYCAGGKTTRHQGTRSRPGKSCQTIYASGVRRNGLYYVKLSSGLRRVYCDMSRGGFTLVSAFTFGRHCTFTGSARSNPATSRSCSKLSDRDINELARNKIFYSKINGHRPLFTRYTGHISATRDKTPGRVFQSHSLGAVRRTRRFYPIGYGAWCFFHQENWYKSDRCLGSSRSDYRLSLEYIGCRHRSTRSNKYFCHQSNCRSQCRSSTSGGAKVFVQ